MVLNSDVSVLGLMAEHNPAEQILLIPFGDMCNKYVCLTVEPQNLRLVVHLESEVFGFGVWVFF